VVASGLGVKAALPALVLAVDLGECEG